MMINLRLSVRFSKLIEKTSNFMKEEVGIPLSNLCTIDLLLYRA